MRLRIKAATVLALAAMGALAISSANAQIVKFGNLIVEINGNFSPKKLPRARSKPAPITLKLDGSMATADRTHVPALKTIYLEFDKSGHLNTKGLASCTVGKLQSTLTTQARRACSKASTWTTRGSGRRVTMTRIGDRARRRHTYPSRSRLAGSAACRSSISTTVGPVSLTHCSSPTVPS